MSGQEIQLIVGLGNPGAKYERTRHNAGFWLVDQLARQFNGSFNQQDKFFGEICRIDCGGADVRLLKPQTYMNESGRSVRAVAQFFKIPVQNILVAYDEIDLPPGKIKLKKGGGHGGHNGIRDIVAQQGADFLRMRIGVGHPGNKAQVVNYVLGEPSKKEHQLIEQTIDDGVRAVPVLVSDGLQKATHQLHSQNSSAEKVADKPAKKSGGKSSQKSSDQSARKNGTSQAEGNDQADKQANNQQAASKKAKTKKTPPPSRRQESDDGDEPASLKDQLLALLKRK